MNIYDFDGVPLNKIDSIGVQKFINHKSKTLKASTVRQIYAILPSALTLPKV
jgi:hypothetical protein